MNDRGSTDLSSNEPSRRDIGEELGSAERAAVHKIFDAKNSHSSLIRSALIELVHTIGDIYVNRLGITFRMTE